MTVDEVKALPNVELILNSTVVSLHGDSGLSSVTVENIRTGERINLEVPALLVCVGQIPSNEAFADIVALDENGYIIAGEDCKTNVPGIFAAGDCRTKAIRQLTTAAADGAVAALS